MTSAIEKWHAVILAKNSNYINKEKTLNRMLYEPSVFWTHNVWLGRQCTKQLMVWHTINEAEEEFI